jgi:hypothetical protein
VRRARAGATDAPLVVGTNKDLIEATARHVLVETTGAYQGAMSFPATLYQAFDRLGLTPAPPAVMQALGGDPRAQFQQALYLLACAVNRLRNAEGTGHGRPAAASVEGRDARLLSQAAGWSANCFSTTSPRSWPAPTDEGLRRQGRGRQLRFCRALCTPPGPPEAVGHNLASASAPPPPSLRAGAGRQNCRNFHLAQPRRLRAVLDPAAGREPQRRGARPGTDLLQRDQRPRRLPHRRRRQRPTRLHPPG